MGKKYAKYPRREHWINWLRIPVCYWVDLSKGVNYNNIRIRTVMFQRIELFYNRKRLHSSLEYLSSVQGRLV